MVFGSRNRNGEKKRAASPEFDLLTTLFGLPNRHTLECEKRQRARRVVLSYVTDGDRQHAGDEEDHHHHWGLTVVERSGGGIERFADSESEIEEEEEDDDDDVDDCGGSCESRQVAVRVPRRESVKKAPVERRNTLKKVPAHRHSEKKREDREEAPRPQQTRAIERAKLKKKKKRTERAASDVSHVSRASQTSPTSSTRKANATASPTNNLPPVAPTQLRFVPQPPFPAPVQPVIQHPVGIQPQQQPLPEGYYFQPPFVHPTAGSNFQMTSYPVPVPLQQWNGAPSQPLPTGVTVGPNQENGLQPEKSGPPTNALEVKRIQNQLDETAAKLQEKPRDAELNSKMKSLQALLNDALNKATARQSYEKKAPPSPASSEKRNNTQQQIIVARQDPDESVTSSSHAETPTQPKGDQRRSPKICGKDTLRHRCYGCGNSRSMWYHEKYPVETSRRVRNLCENCRDDLIQGGLVGQRHYCFGCGRARSTSFHDKHLAIPGDPLLLSYCKHCEDDMRTVDVTTNASGRGSRVSTGAKRSDRRERNKTDHDYHHDSPGSSRSLTSSSSSQYQLEEQLSTASSNEEPQYPTRPSHEETKQDGLGNNLDGAYFPDRKVGSTKRRAERAATTEVEHDSSNDVTRSTEEDSKYKQPWVEDSSSYYERNAMLSKAPGQDTQQVDESSSSPSSPQQSNAQWDEPPRTPSPHSKTSDESHDTSSSRSSAGKSVTFKPSVSVRQPSRRATSDVSSDSDVEDAPIKPDDNSKPSRAGIFGDSPVMNEYGHPVCMSDRAGSERSHRSSAYSPRLWMFGQGSYASAADEAEHRVDDFEDQEAEGGIFSGMSAFDTDDWRKFAEETSDKGSAIRGDGSHDGPTTEKPGSWKEYYGWSQQSAEHDERETRSATPRPGWDFGSTFMDGYQDRRNSHPRPSSHSGIYRTDDQFPPQTADDY